MVFRALSFRGLPFKQVYLALPNLLNTMSRTYRYVYTLLTILFTSSLAFAQVSRATKLIQYPQFSIRVPKQWVRLEVETEDSFFGYIQIGKDEFVGFDLGWYSNNLNEDEFGDYYQVEDGKVYKFRRSKKRKERLLIGKADSTTLESVRRNKVAWIYIDGHKAKLITPKVTTRGTTGVYIDSLWMQGCCKVKFQMSTSNLTFLQQQQLIAAIKTLKFYQHHSK
ncbi:hypothetical protein A0256_23705 [Mucilaginibacter sp. PAMC 26640]|nr:hypothetical protein A0256_23705 [Mucilaginibacter sp. PAMC 26640]